MKRIVIAGIVMLALRPVFAQEKPDSLSLKHFFNEYLKDYRSSVSSAAVVFVQGDSVLYKGSLGYANPGRQVAANPDSTVYQIGSNSKLFVAVAAMQLYEQGRLDLQADINRYLTDIRVRNPWPQPVTMASLLTHTSGVEDRKLGRTQGRDEKLMTLGDFFQKFPPQLAHPPGDQLNYSGTAISLAAHVIEEITKEPFYRYIEEHIYAPLQMTRSSFRQPLQSDLFKARAAMMNLPPLITYPEGGMAATVEDLSHFLMACLNGGSYKGNVILKPGTMALLQSRHFSAYPGIPGIGYGFFEARINGHTVWMHTGDYQHASVLCLVPDLRLGFFFVMNTAKELHDPVLTGFVKAVFDRFYPAAAPAGEKYRPVGNNLEQFEGYYRDNAVPRSGIEKFLFGLLFSAGEGSIRLDKQKNKLVFIPPGSATRFELEQTGPVTFKGDDGRFGLDIVFRKSKRTTTLFINAGPLGQYSMEKTPWVMTQIPQFIFHLLALFLFGIWLLVAFTRMIIRSVKKRKGNVTVHTRLENLAFLNLVLVSFFADLGFILFSVLGATIPNAAMIVGIPAMFKILPLCYTAACIMALPLTGFIFLVWKHSCWKLSTRLFFTVVALAAILFIPFCVYWNLFGVHL